MDLALQRVLQAVLLWLKGPVGKRPSTDHELNYTHTHTHTHTHTIYNLLYPPISPSFPVPFTFSLSLTHTHRHTHTHTHTQTYTHTHAYAQTHKHLYIITHTQMHTPSSLSTPPTLVLTDTDLSSLNP